MIAIESHPFEVTEEGWGEFEIGIKIFFEDPNEKPLALVHNLKLYNVEEDPQSGILQIVDTAADEPVISEHYDEIVPPLNSFFYLLCRFLQSLLKSCKGQ